MEAGEGNGRTDVIPDAVDQIEQRIERIERVLSMHLPHVPAAARLPEPPQNGHARANGRVRPGPGVALEDQLSDIAARLDSVVAALDGSGRFRADVIDLGNRQLAETARVLDLQAQLQLLLLAGLRGDEIIASKLDHVRNAVPRSLARRAAHALARRWPTLAFRIKRVLHGGRERRLAKLIRGSGYFDEAFYAAEHLAVTGCLPDAGADPALHYLRHGQKLGLSPGRRFDAAAYLDSHSDVVAVQANALVHYLVRGRFEGRAALPVVREARAPGAEEPPRDWTAIVDATIDIRAVLAEIAIPHHDAPVVSIIVPCFNKVKFTLNCLRSISENLPRVGFEVIVADDASDDAEVDPLFELENLQVVRQPRNLGFLRNCNAAAAAARGRYLYFLNNDVTVHEGWLDALVDVFENPRPGEKVGVVGSKLLFPDGSLQEAGGIVWCDGSGWNFGRNGAADAPEFNYLKPVDFCSGASIMVDRALWHRLGGFDERYAPAYYEDVDLAFAARREGYQVYYCPRSVVTHYDGVSSGTDTTAGAKRHQILNQPKFVEKWHRELAAQLPPGASTFLARDRAHNGNVIVFIDHHVPKYDTNAGDLAVWEYMLLLRDLGFAVKFLPHNGYPTPGYTERLQALGIEVVVDSAPGRPFDDWIRANGVDVACFWIARPYVAVDFVEQIRHHSRAKIAYFTVDLHFARRAQDLSIDWRKPFQNADLSSLMDTELSVIRDVDVVLSASDDETAIIRSLVPECVVRTIPIRLYGDDEFDNACRPFGGRDGLLFLGGFAHPPNLDAVNWFMAEIFPRLRAERPDITLTIAGSDAPDEIRRFDGVGGVRVLGFVEDLRPVFAAARYFVCPLRLGAGMKGKIVTSLGFGLPVITTSIGNQGLAMDRRVGVPVCDTAEDFADAVLALYDDETAWTDFSKRSRELAAERFSRSGAVEILSDLFGVAVLHCHVCGNKPAFIPPDTKGNLREGIVCRACGTSYRTNHLAECLIRELGAPPSSSLVSEREAIGRLEIYEVSGDGSLWRTLGGSDNYVRSAYFENVRPGEMSDTGFRCEDVERLTFPDGSFDIVISEDVFEHVSDPMRGFAEIHRVLKPGGRHIFTIPYYRQRAKTAARAARTDDGIVHYDRPEYHGDPFNRDGALVYTDFGQDIADMLRAIGFEVDIAAIHDPRFANSWNEVFITRKPPA